MLGDDRVLKMQLAQFAYDANSLFLWMSLNLTIPHLQERLLVDTNSRYNRRTTLNQIVQRQYTILNIHPPLLNHQYRIIHLAK